MSRLNMFWDRYISGATVYHHATTHTDGILSNGNDLLQVYDNLNGVIYLVLEMVIKWFFYEIQKCLFHETS